MYLGIDFGTSFSQVATIYLDNPLLLLSPGEYGIPSVLYYDDLNDILVGQDALDAGQGNDAANLITEVKMKLHNPYVVLGNKVFSTKEIVREIIKYIVQRAVQIAKTRSISTKIEGVVLCVPAKFGMQERGLIYEAARQCLKELPTMELRALGVYPGEGLCISDIIKEPVAAALSYYRSEAENNKRILVYDLGGGTCDIALIRADESLMEHYDVEDSDMIRLGGRDWDQRLVNHIANQLKNVAKIDIMGNPGYEEKVRRAAITVKHKLSDPNKTRAIAQIEINGRMYPIQVQRNVFDEITCDLLRSTLDCLQSVYDGCPNSSDIQDIICVGGSSNMLQVQEGIRKRFPQCNVKVHLPEHAVVSGASAYAEMLAGKKGNGIQVSDIASFSYGVKVYLDYSKDPEHEVISNILLKGSKLPASYVKPYSPVTNTSSLVFNIYESECTKQNYELTEPSMRYIGQVTLNVPGMTPETSVNCQIQLNCQGMLEVTATHPNGKKETVPINLRELG